MRSIDKEPAPFTVEDPADAIDEGDDLPPEEALEDAALPASVKAGAEAIRAFWTHAPKGPGVYRMIGNDGEVLYVGKAKSVRKRIASYMRAAGHTWRFTTDLMRQFECCSSCEQLIARRRPAASSG